MAKTAAELNDLTTPWRRNGERIFLIPTMGALHLGHLSLITEAAQHYTPRARLIVSIFVNPTQFGAGEDLAAYPRDPTGDLEKLAPLGVDAVFTPTAETIYPEGFAASIDPGAIATRLEGAHRPGHFSGVATIVTKLFGLSRCTDAIFGEKDFQQLAVIRQITRDLNLPVTIHGGMLIRDTDGLALSSRNAYLSEKGREIAPALYRSLQQLVAEIQSGEPITTATEMASKRILDAGFEAVDYIELVDANTLEPTTSADRPLRLLATARLEGVRLLDNLAVC